MWSGPPRGRESKKRRASVARGARRGAVPTATPSPPLLTPSPSPRLSLFPLSAPQGAQLLAKHGVNVPPGIAVTKVEDVAAAAKEMAGDDGEVRMWKWKWRG